MNKISQWLNLSRAAWIATAFCVLCIVTVLFAWVAYQWDPDRVAWADYMSLSRAIWISILLALATTAVYWTARLWLEELPTEKSELKDAWQAGIQAMRDVGVNVRERPLFLLLGSDAVDRQAALMSASGQKFLVNGTAAGKSPLNWFVSEEAIFLFCNTGTLGPTVSRLGNQISGQSTSLEYTESSIGSGLDTTAGPATGLAGELERSDSGGAGEAHGNSGSGANQSDTDAAGSAAPDSGGTAVAVEARTTAQATQALAVERSVEQKLASVESLLAGEVETAAVLRNQAESEPLLKEPLNSVVLQRCQQQTEEFAVLLRSLRRPTVPFNGVAVLFPFDTLAESRSQATLCGLAARRDLVQLENHLRAHAPVSIVATHHGAEMRQVIRRVGESVSSQHALGIEVDPRTLLESQSVQALSASVVRRTSQLVYQLFRRPDALTRPGNEGLARFLFSVRGAFQTGLSTAAWTTLADRHDRKTLPTLLDGIYVAADGETVAEQGFFKAIVDRMIGQQQLLEWHASERRIQRLTQWGVRLAMAVGSIGIVTLLWQLWTRSA